jgi:hypothetical protein
LTFFSFTATACKQGDQIPERFFQGAFFPVQIPELLESSRNLKKTLKLKPELLAVPMDTCYNAQEVEGLAHPLRMTS